MRGLILKAAREIWITTLLFSVALLLVKALLTFVLPQVYEGTSDIFESLPFAKKFINAMLGTEIGNRINARTLQAFLWVHPVVLSLIWAFEIVVCTRCPAGEIDRGTIDFLLGLPVSRRSVYACETIAWLCSGVVLIGMGWLGHAIMAPTMPDEMRPSPAVVRIVMLNLFCVYLAVGGIGFMVSACCQRRGRAVAVLFSIVLLSFLLNFLAQFWEPAKKIAFLSVMDYYQPAIIVQTGAVPWGHIAALLATGTVPWILGGEIMARRNICTV